MAPSRRTRLHPQIPPIHASEDGAGVARRLHPQIHASDEGAAGVTTPAAAAAASLPDDDDILREILVCLPPQPSSLPRASAVCKRWRGLVTDPKFHRQFYAHHGKPPLLGVIQRDRMFKPMLDRPDRIPPRRLSLLRFRDHDDYDVLNCCHGLVLIQDCKKKKVLVCDPVTRKHRRVAIPPELSRVTDLAGAVLCAATDVGHVHGGCHSTPFKVVLVSTGTRTDSRGCLACVYSSQTRKWGNFLISTAFPCELCEVRATLVGNALYWLCEGHRMLEFDLDGQSLAVIEGPPVKNDDDDVLYGNYHIIQGEDAAVGFVILSHPRLQTWQRKVNAHGVATWVPWKTIEMHTILGLPSPNEGLFGWMLGYDEVHGVIFLYLKAKVYTVQIMTMQARKLHTIHNTEDFHPFTSFFTPGMGISGLRYIG